MTDPMNNLGWRHDVSEFSVCEIDWGLRASHWLVSHPDAPVDRGRGAKVLRRNGTPPLSRPGWDLATPSYFPEVECFASLQKDVRSKEPGERFERCRPIRQSGCNDFNDIAPWQSRVVADVVNQPNEGAVDDFIDIANPSASSHAAMYIEASRSRRIDLIPAARHRIYLAETGRSRPTASGRL